MVVENINIYDLVPSQIEEMIKKLQNALEIIKDRKQTLSKIALFEKGKNECPYCHECNIIKKGFSETGIQRYKCKECGKKFNDLSGTPFSGTRLTYKQIDTFMQCFRDKISIRKTAKRMNVGKNTVHLLRLKVMDSLKEIRENTKLSGEIESDELCRTINLKGTKKDKMPRYSKPRTSKGSTTRGISKHKICIASAIDEYDNSFLEIVGTGEITSNIIDKSLSGKLVDVRKLITDCKSAYESIAKQNQWNLIQVKSCGHTDENGNSLANINSLHSELTKFLAHFRGVSTKHLQGYLDWYTFDRYLNYTFEDDNQNRELLKNTIIRSTVIKASNMYDNYSGIDFFEVYSDYNYVAGPVN